MATFYIEAIENTDIALVMVGSPTIGTVKYGINDTTCPNTYTVTTSGTPISLTAGQKCYWTITSTTTDFSDLNYLKFTSAAKINVGGNLSDLIGGDTKIPRNYCFSSLFDNCTNLIDASNLVVVNDFNSKRDCYGNMFYNCTSLTTPPELPATTLANSCYYYMFFSCTSLTTPPELPATTLASFCYQSMFSGCTSLTTAPELPATTLADYCYSGMFGNCKSLTTAPELPATTLATQCYNGMFRGCTSLTTPPELPATTLANYCYNNMFYGCTNIKLSETQIAPYFAPYRIPSEETGTEGTSSLANMFTDTGGTFTGTPTINTTYYIPKVDSNVQLYDGDIKLYPITKAENVMGLDEVVSDTITGQKGTANGVATLGADGKVPTIQLDIENSAISGSTKPITSGAVYSILGTVEAALAAI